MLDLLERNGAGDCQGQIIACVSRLTKVESGAKTLASSNNIARLFGRKGAAKDFGEMPGEYRDAMMRVAANLIIKSGLEPKAVSDTLFSLGFYAFCRDAIADSDSPDLLVGNAALCISELAKSDSVLQVLDSEGAIELIEPLTRCAHKRQGAAQRNAAIALARLAKGGKNGEYVQKLREHHAFEIIAKYVKI